MSVIKSGHPDLVVLEFVYSKNGYRGKYSISKGVLFRIGA